MTTVNPKYRLGEKHPTLELYRIVALRDFGDVKAGDVGGWVEKEYNLSHEGNCWVYNDARVFDDAQVYGNARVSENAQVSGTALVTENAQVFAQAEVYGKARVYENAWVYGNAQVCGSALISGKSWIYGNAQISEKSWIYGDAQVFEEAQVFGKAQVCGNAWVFSKAIVAEKHCIRTGNVKKALSVDDLLRCSIGVVAVNGVVRLYKRVNADMSSEFDSSFVYPESGLVEADCVNEDPTVSCGAGLHFSYKNYRSWVKTPEHKILAADIRVEDIVCVLEEKVRCRKATIVGIVG